MLKVYKFDGIIFIFFICRSFHAAINQIDYETYCSLRDKTLYDQSVVILIASS